MRSKDRFERIYTVRTRSSVSIRIERNEREDLEVNSADITRSLLEGAAFKSRVARELGATIARAGGLFVEGLRAGGKLLFFGNGGSAADAQHLRQIQALGRPGDVAIAISTSGRSRNVILGIEAARGARLATIALTGGDGGNLAAIVDVAIVVPSITTARIQECHIAIGHVLCEYGDEELRLKDGGSGNPLPKSQKP
jgi:D-sedoheptulose 7-phosphate isomerase